MSERSRIRCFEVERRRCCDITKISKLVRRACKQTNKTEFRLINSASDCCKRFKQENEPRSALVGTDSWLPEGDLSCQTIDSTEWKVDS
jgi:hypothetical protein